MSADKDSNHWSTQVQHASLHQGSVSVVAAPVWRRFCADTLDLSILVAIARGMYAHPAGLPEQRFDWLDYAIDLIGHYSYAFLPWIALSLSTYLIMTIIARHLWSASIGERIMRIQLIDYTGDPPRAWQSILHTVGNLVSWCLCGFGYFWVLASRNRQTWANLLSRTILITSNSAP